MAKVTPTASHSNSGGVVTAARPGTKAPEGATQDPDKKIVRVAYPATLSKDPAIYPLKAIPTDFDPKRHEPLGKKDFAKPSLYFDFRATSFEKTAKQYRDRANTARQTGDGAGTGKANRLLKMMAKAADLRKELEAAGINVAALLTQTQPQANPAGAPTDTAPAIKV